ncbi:MAG: hypothetical protein H6849_04875 [Alphaproteobacteria bacterium]|nr:MAG: hypothetical protein H6849_04875 [Alphaproteobacteria bacterium]
MKHRIMRIFIAIPGILAGIFSCAACPMCFPVYASLVTFLGIDHSTADVYLLVIMYVSLATSLWLMYTSARQKRAGWGIFFIAFGAAALVVYAKINNMPFTLYLSLAIYFGSFIFSKYTLRKFVHRTLS